MPALPFSTSTILLYCVAIAAFLVYLPLPIVAAERAKLGIEAFQTPRAMTDKLPLYARRAFWAHQNGFESFLLFAVAALMAYVVGVQSAIAGWAAILYVVARTLYPFFYISNILPGRSLMFALASFGTLTLFVQSLSTLK
jgi:uncharacterized MAPEG superfamily protein